MRNLLLGLLGLFCLSLFANTANLEKTASSIVRISSYGKKCGAVKVGPYALLTAANCVVDNRGDSILGVGDRLRISAFIRENSFSAVVLNVVVHPEYVGLLKSSEDLIRSVSRASRTRFLPPAVMASIGTSDLALIKLDQKSKDIPIAKIDYRKVSRHSKVGVWNFCKDDGESIELGKGYYYKSGRSMFGSKVDYSVLKTYGLDSNQDIRSSAIKLGIHKKRLNNISYVGEKGRFVHACMGSAGIPLMNAEGSKVVGIKGHTGVVKVSPKEKALISHAVRVSRAAVWLKKTLNSLNKN